MSLNKKNKNTYSLWRNASVSILACVLLLSTCFSPFILSGNAVKFDNNPPLIPSSPNPENNSINIPVSSSLSWIGGDPDNDTVTYDVYFGESASPSLVAANQSETIYDPGEDLAFHTTFYWRIIAWDNQSASTAGPLWCFTTAEEYILSVDITKPVENALYFRDDKLLTLKNRTIVYGGITITANVSADATVEKVEFYIDDKLLGNDTSAPYAMDWSPLLCFSNMSFTHVIKVIAYDDEENTASDSISVLKWRFHPLPFIVIGIILASTLVPHTTIKGLVFNMKETGGTVTFFALHISYKTIGPLKVYKGHLNFRSCTAGAVIGPKRVVSFGPLHKFAWVSMTCLGRIHYPSEASLTDLLQSLKNTRTSE